MVRSMHPDATHAGVDILRAGGNAIDAGVAVATTLAVTNHNWAGLAGDSAWLIYDSRARVAHHLDGYSVCPAALTAERLASHFRLDAGVDAAAFREEPEGFRELGINIAMVPGTPAALNAAWEKFGSLPFERLLEYAVDRAANGIVVSSYVAGSLHKWRAKLQGFPESRAIFFRGNKPYGKGDLLIQKDLAETLRRYARNPAREFACGSTGGLILDCAAQSGAGLTFADLDNYRPVWRQPVEGRYRGRRVIAAGPPTAGLHVIEALQILEHVLTPDMSYAGADALHLLIETLKRALADRRTSGGDPDHMDVPVAQLTEPAYARTLADTIDMTSGAVRARRQPFDRGGHHPFRRRRRRGQYRHGDADHRPRLRLRRGGTRRGVGDERSQWWMSLGDGPNKVAPGRRANIGHAPTMVFDGETPALMLGSPGGFGIVPYVVQTLVNVLDHGLDLQQAIEAPRFQLMDLDRRRHRRPHRSRRARGLTRTRPPHRPVPALD